MSRQELPLIGDLEQQPTLPKVLGPCGKRFRFFGTLMAFVWRHDAMTTRNK
jgi:hypothetical protein